jgi:hypothetical protein
LLSEVEKVQNPAFGALILWHYGTAYQESFVSDPSDFLLFFLVLPMCLHEKTLLEIKSTRKSSGLGKLCQKLSNEREDLIAVHERALRLKRLTLDSITYGIRANLLAVDYKKAKIRSLGDQKNPKFTELKAFFDGAEKLGHFFSHLETVSIFKALQVEA